MTNRSLRPLALAAAGALAVGLFWIARPGHGQAPVVQPVPPRRTPAISRNEDCLVCHNNDETRSYKADTLASAICRLNEWSFYNGKDKHQIAFRVLSKERSRRIVAGLGLPDRDATTVAACLSCHAFPEFEGVRASPEWLTDGVSCVACHGAFQEWVREHRESVRGRQQARVGQAAVGRKDWLSHDRKTKELEFGMTDLWNPLRRAEVCSSCHVGNVNAKKVVTHAMYAAGHPPLPGFEAATFGDAQPRHWQLLGEKTAKQREYLGFAGSPPLEQAQLVAVNGLVVLRESLRMTAAQARTESDQPLGAAWPDFARYDCRSCHHELRTATASAPRLDDRRPGRPAGPEWPQALVFTSVNALARDRDDARAEFARYESLAASLRRATEARPFGDREAVIRSAEGLAAWSDGFLKSHSPTVIDPGRAEAMLSDLCTSAETRASGFDSHRQLAWAFRAVERELRPKAPIPPALQRLGQLLALDLPAPGTQDPVADTLRERLGIVAHYDPNAVREEFRTLQSSLSNR